MPSNEKKRRAERDLKELWQYVDAKYFQKTHKNQIISKVDQIFRQNCPQLFSNNSPNKQNFNPMTPRMGGEESQGYQGTQGRILILRIQSDSKRIKPLTYCTRRVGTQKVQQGAQRFNFEADFNQKFLQKINTNLKIKSLSEPLLSFLTHANSGISQPIQRAAESRLVVTDRDRNVVSKYAKTRNEFTLSRLQQQFGRKDKANQNSLLRKRSNQSSMHNQIKNPEDFNLLGQASFSGRKSLRTKGEGNQLGTENSVVEAKDWRYQDSILSDENMELRGGFKQLYSQILDKIDVSTNWTLNIDKNSQNGEFQEKLDRNVIHAQIRNIFDIEFNKKFQGSIQFPLKMQPRNNYYHSQSNQNKYLFFITDKFEDQDKIQSEQKAQILLQQQQEKLSKLLPIEQKKFSEKSRKMKVTEETKNSKRPNENSGLGFCEPNQIEKQKSNLGFMMSSSEEDYDQQSQNDHVDDQEEDVLKRTLDALKQTQDSTDLKEVSIDQEIENLEKIHSQAQNQLKFDMNLLQSNIVNHKEPESINILNKKIDKEREYIQQQIVQMEIKQMAESITRVTHAMKVSNQNNKNNASQQNPESNEKRQTRGNSNNQDSKTQQSPRKEQKANESVNLNDLAKDKIGTQNRPFLLRKILDNQVITSFDNQKNKRNQSPNKKKEGSPSKQSTNQNGSQSSSFEHIFRIEFDQSTGIPPCWIDTKTLNYLNMQRDNIFASSGQYDMMINPRNAQAAQQNGANRPKNKSGSNKQQNKSNTDHINDQFMNKESVAFQRGKRSCTLSDLNNKGKKNKSSNNKNQSKGPQGKSLIEQGQDAIKNANKGIFGCDSNQQSEYDFCHNCKQLKNKYLLVSCKYSSKVSSSATQKQGFIYNPYPYEPQNYTVNNVKIHNVDFQNRAQMRGLIELIRKDLRHKNTGIEAARQSMQEFMNENSNSQSKQGRKSNIKGGQNDFKDEIFDIATFQHNNQQLMTYLQDLDINPYTLDPQNQNQFFTDSKLLFPNLHQELYPPMTTQKSQGQSQKGQKGSSGGGGGTQFNKQITYKCHRKFCTFCLRTQYEDNLNDIMKNKNWHCHHCTGYCICTRCLRQDIITQLKAYLISLGGNLNSLRDQSMSLFDQQIFKNYNEHLELTLGQNQWLYQKYPYFLKMVMGQSFTDPTHQDHQAATKMPKKSTFKPMSNIQQSQDDSDDESSDGAFLPKGKGLTGCGNGPFVKSHDEKVALSQLFTYSLLNMKMDDQNNMVSLHNKASVGSNSNELSQRISDKRYLEQIVKSIKGHDLNVINRIQKRRGRKKFILSNSSDESGSQDTSHKNYLNKRDQKYLSKVNLLGFDDGSGNQYQLSEQNGRFNKGASLDDLKEYQVDWPKNSTKSLQTIDRLLNTFGLNNKEYTTHNNGGNVQTNAQGLQRRNGNLMQSNGQKSGKCSVNVSKSTGHQNDKKQSFKKRSQILHSRANKGKVLRLRPQLPLQNKKNGKK